MMRRHTHGWMTQQSNQGAVSGHRIRGDTPGILEQEGYSRKDRIRRKTGESGGQGDRRARGTERGYTRRYRIRRRTTPF